MTPREQAQFKLYLVTRIKEDDYGYDDYIGFVVSAENEEQAITLTTTEYGYRHSGWPVAERLKAKLIGYSLLDEIGIVFDSFNAG
jgi:hypothetical protein